MKKLAYNLTHPAIVPLLLMLVALGVAGINAGCNTTAQRTAANTLSATHDVVQSGVESYFVATAKGQASTNGIPTVAGAYNKFQKVYVTAVDLAQNNTNALAPANVIQEASDVAAVIGQFYKPAADQITSKLKSP